MLLKVKKLDDNDQDPQPGSYPFPWRRYSTKKGIGKINTKEGHMYMYVCIYINIYTYIYMTWTLPTKYVS